MNTWIPLGSPGRISGFGIAVLLTMPVATAVSLSIQLANFRQDPTFGKMWFGRNGVCATIDLDNDTPGMGWLGNISLPQGQSIVWMYWNEYSDLFGAYGNGLLPVIGELRAQVQLVGGSYGAFAVSEPPRWAWAFVVN
jgi:hypothetical protein